MSRGKIISVLLSVIYIMTGIDACALPKAKLTKQGRVVMELSDKDLSGEFIFTSRLVSSAKSGKVYSAGQMKEEPVIVKFTAQEDSIVLSRIYHRFCENDTIFTARGRYKEGVEEVFPVILQKGNSYRIDATEFFSREIPAVWLIPHKEMEKDSLMFFSVNEVLSEQGCIMVNASYSYSLHGNISMCYYLSDAGSNNFERMREIEDVGVKTIRFDRFKDSIKCGNEDFICRWNIREGGRICFAIDSRFPSEWVPYIKEGLEDWNKAFRKAGLGDVIKVSGVKDAARYNGFRDNMVRFYSGSDEKNAKGQAVADPRTGEILQGDILWWEGVEDLLATWRYLQTAASDPAARTLDYPIEILGPMIRYTISHEMGHILGLTHNMGASFAYPADSLHSVSFTKEYGTAASVMDYARFNHIATSEDVSRGVSLNPPRIGPYDYKAIAVLYGAGKPIDTAYTFFSPLISAAIPDDPSAQSESLSNNLLYSSRRGIENCIVLSDSASVWCGMRDRVATQYFRYVSLALSNIGGAVHGTPVPADIQLETLQFVYDALARSSELLKDAGEERKTVENAVSKGRKSVIETLEGNFLPERVKEQRILDYQQYIEFVKKIKLSYN